MGRGTVPFDASLARALAAACTSSLSPDDAERLDAVGPWSCSIHNPCAAGAAGRPILRGGRRADQAAHTARPPQPLPGGSS